MKERPPADDLLAVFINREERPLFQFVRPVWRAVGLDGELPHDAILNTAFVGSEDKHFIIVAVNIDPRWCF